MDRDVTICLDNDTDFKNEPPVKKHKSTNALQSKAQWVDALANELRDKYNKIQYKLWAEALDTKRHDSKGNPPIRPIWDVTRKQKVQAKNSVDTMATAFTKMAKSVASALTPAETPKPTCISPVKESRFSQPHNISPTEKINL